MDNRRPTPPATPPALWSLALILLAILLRLGLVAWRGDELLLDPDAYRGHAQSLVDGHGYSAPGSMRPTAFRPPLYPLLLTIERVLPGKWTIGIMHALFGALTAWGTVILARNLRLPSSGQLLASGLVAVDPLLLRYTTQTMTETTATLLAVWLIVGMQSLSRDPASTPWRYFLVAVLFGLNALCRPTVWAFGTLWLLGVALSRIFHRYESTKSPHLASPSPQTTSPTASRTQTLALLIGLAVTVGPWAIRNTLVLGSPIITTTHGGYTLLLGNNPAYYEEVVKQPWGTVWDGSHGPGQEHWYAQVKHTLIDRGLVSELAQSAAMSQAAWQTIRDQPLIFLRACLIRQSRFWNAGPSSQGAVGWSPPIIWGTRLFYLFAFSAASVALFQVLLRRNPDWTLPLLFAFSIAAVHLLYWCDTRMRCPIVPVLATLSAAGFCELRRTFSQH